GVRAGDDALEASALVATEGGKPRHLDQIRNARAVVLLDQAIELDEGTAERVGEALPERRLAGAAQTDERDAARALGRGIAAGVALDQLGNGRQRRLRPPPQPLPGLGT